MPDRPALEEATPKVVLKTLGTLTLTGTGYRRPTGLTFLAYLILEGPATRSHLRSLFWPERDQAGASLRVLLSTLRKELPPQSLTAGSLTVSASLPCDASHLLEGTVDPDLIYPGPFLHGVQLGEVSSELEDWVEVTRERLALEAQRQLLAVIEQSRSLMEVQRRLEQCLRLPGAAPLEPAMLQRMLALAPPGSEVERLIRSDLRTLDLGLLPVQNPVAGRLLGRDRLLATLLSFLGTGEQVMELTGAAGIGKTSVLMTLLQEAAPLFSGQTVLMDLEDVNSSTEAAGQLATTLGLSLPAGEDQWAALGTTLAAASWFIALDGTEHLDDLADGVERLLARAPWVQVVMGGQRRLMRRGPHLLLEGLGTPAPGLDLALVRQTDGVKLFLQVASQVVQSSPSRDQDLQMIAAIVRRLDGHPLAIRLAALDLAVRPLPVLHQQVLDDRLSDAPLFQRLYQRARARRSREDQQVLARLATVPAMTVDDAVQVLETSSGRLAELQAQAFLSEREGRLQVTPVLRPLAAADLALGDTVLTRHADFFLERLTSWTPDDVEAARERSNVVQALLTRLEHGGGEVAQVEWLMTYFEHQGLLAAGLETLARLTDAAGTAPPAVQAALQVARAWLAFRSARFQDAEGLARGLTARTDSATRDARMKGFNILYAVMIQQQGRTGDAVTVLEQAIELAEDLGNTKQRAMYLGNLCEARTHQGNYGAARQALTQAIQAREGQPPGPEDALNRVRDLKLRYDVGEEDAPIISDAHRLLGELPVLRADWVRGEVLVILGKAAGRAGHLNEVWQVMAALEDHLRRHPSPVLEIACALLQAEGMFAQHETPAARIQLLRAADLCLQYDEQHGALEVLLLAADDLQWHDLKFSRQVARAVLLSPASSAVHRHRTMVLGAEHSTDEPFMPQVLLREIQQRYAGTFMTVDTPPLTDH